MKDLKLLIIVSLLIITSACTSSPDNQITSQQTAAAVIYTAAALIVEVDTVTPPAPTTNLQPLIEATIPPTEIPQSTSPATIQADLVNLRSGPSTFFRNFATLTFGMQVTPLGMIADGTWINVNANLNDGTSVDGWVFASLLDLSSLDSSLPILELPAEYTISGMVTDTDGEPINAVRIASTVVNESAIQRAEATSNRNGYFYIYAPPDLTGPFNVEIVAVNCSSNISNILADGTCMVQDYFPINWRTTISLPQAELIQFSYEKAVAFLEGKVVYQDGNGASQILLQATRRTDKVQSEFVTPQGGVYRLPLGLGIWDVVAIRFLSDGTPLLSETYVYDIKSPGQLVEPLIISYTEIVER